MVYRWARATLAVIGILMIVYHVGFELSQITSPSMAPTLQGDETMNGDWVLAERVSFWFRHPRRWEVISLINKEGNLIMKRVVGLPGERVSMTAGGEIRINGKAVARPASLSAIEYRAFGNLFHDREVDCKDGYFVLGDDSKDSYDSRYEGPFAPWRVRGRAWLVVGPAGRRGWVNP
jgi:signal peptidase I